MLFKAIELSSWARREHFDYFMGDSLNTFSIAKVMEVTRCYDYGKQAGFKFYGQCIHANAVAANSVENYRYALAENNSLILWDKINPTYTVLDNTELPFSFCWTDYVSDRELFQKNFLHDRHSFPGDGRLFVKPSMPVNTFFITCLPWTNYSTFNFSFMNLRDHFAPVVTIGKIYKEGHRRFVPMTLSSHHATCDGYHASMFLEIVQEHLESVDW